MELDIDKAIKETVTEEIVMKAQETQEAFIFETIHPYCENILRIKIDKEKLKRILLNGIQASPTGHWIDNTDLGYHVSICSNCGWRGHGDTCLIYRPKYCPNCGAKMDWIQKSEGKADDE